MDERGYGLRMCGEHSLAIFQPPPLNELQSSLLRILWHRHLELVEMSENGVQSEGASTSKGKEPAKGETDHDVAFWARMKSTMLEAFKEDPSLL